MYKEEKHLVQFRMGKQLRTRIDEKAKASGISRNTWMINAITTLADLGRPEPLAMTASELLADKVTIPLWLSQDMLDHVDNWCKQAGQSRTLWLLDACTTQLARGEADERDHS